MARKTKLDIVRDAIAIQGYVTTRYEGQSYRITGISGTDTDGSWITTQTTPDLRGWVRVKKMQASVLTQARDIIARADEIRASREATSRQTMSAMMQS